ncbi:MAG: EamA family transporter [Candidatus Nanopelagicales bacterium]
MAIADRIEPATPRNPQVVGVVMYLLAALFFAINGVLGKSAIEAGLDPLPLVELRNAGAMVILIVIVAIVRPSAFRVTRKELPFLVVYGVLAFTLVQFLYFFTISRVPVGVGTLLAFLAPIIVALYVKFVRKQPVRSRIWLAIFLTLLGLALVAQVWQGLTLDSVGLMSGLLLAFFLALYWILGESGQGHRDALSLTMWGFIFSTVTWSIIAPWTRFPFQALTENAAPMRPGWPGLPIWLVMLIGIVFGTVISFLLVLGSLRRLGAARAGIVGTSEPVWAGILALLFLGETLTLIQGLGGLIVIAGIIVAETSRAQHVTTGEFPVPEQSLPDSTAGATDTTTDTPAAPN